MVLVLAFVSTGCLTGDVGVKINKDGSGKVDIKIFPTDELQQLIVAGNLVPVAKKAVDQVRDSSFEQINEDGRVGYQVALPFDDYQELGQVLTEGAAVGDVHLRVFSDFKLTEINGNWTLEGALAPELLSEDLKADPTTDQLIGSQGFAPLNSDLRLTISLPGQVTSTNGTKTGSGTAVWALKTNENAVLKMATVPKPLLSDTQKVLLGALLAVLFGVFLLVWGSQRSWGSGTERKERKRTKKMKFAGPAGPAKSWAGQGPVAHVPEGTVPKSGPMPPRAIPTLNSPNGAPAGAFAESAPRIPETGELPPVAPPVAPTVSDGSPNPWAPHRPGAPLPSNNLPGTDRQAAVYGTAPVPTPGPASTPTPAPADEEAPVASPATAAAPTPAPAPMAEKSAPVPEPAPAAQQMSAEDASTHHDSFYGDPANEMIGLESKVAEARLADLDPLAPSAAAIPDAPVAPGSATAKQDQPSSDKAPWWFESETGAAKPATQPTPAPEPAWTPSDAGSSGASPFSTDAGSLAEGIDPAVDEHEIDNPHYVAVGGGFFDYEPGDDEADGATSDASEAEAPSAATAPAESPAWTAPEPSPAPVPTPEPEPVTAEPEAAIGDEPAWASETDWDPDPAADYPSIDGAGGLEEGLPIAAPVEEEMEYPSIDGDGDLGIAPDDSTIPPDWYPDPDDPNRYRWWDGVDWTDYVSESGS